MTISTEELERRVRIAHAIADINWAYYERERAKTMELEKRIAALNLNQLTRRRR